MFDTFLFIIIAAYNIPLVYFLFTNKYLNKQIKEYEESNRIQPFVGQKAVIKISFGNTFLRDYEGSHWKTLMDVTSYIPVSVIKVSDDKKQVMFKVDYSSDSEEFNRVMWKEFNADLWIPQVTERLCSWYSTNSPFIEFYSEPKNNILEEDEKRDLLQLIDIAIVDDAKKETIVNRINNI